MNDKGSGKMAAKVAKPKEGGSNIHSVKEPDAGSTDKRKTKVEDTRVKASKSFF